jgi:hypothetical protein
MQSSERGGRSNFKKFAGISSATAYSVARSRVCRAFTIHQLPPQDPPPAERSPRMRSSSPSPRPVTPPSRQAADNDRIFVHGKQPAPNSPRGAISASITAARCQVSNAVLPHLSNQITLACPPLTLPPPPYPLFGPEPGECGSARE